MNESLDVQHKMETDGNHEKTAKVGVLAENYFFTLVIQKNSCYFLWPSTTKVTNHNYHEYQLVLYSDGVFFHIIIHIYFMVHMNPVVTYLC